MEAVLDKPMVVTDMKKRLADIMLAVSWREFANTYFEKSWVHMLPPQASPPKRSMGSRFATAHRGVFVENIGIEPMTSCMPCKRSSQLS